MCLNPLFLKAKTFNLLLLAFVLFILPQSLLFSHSGLTGHNRTYNQLFWSPINLKWTTPYKHDHKLDKVHLFEHNPNDIFPREKLSSITFLDEDNYVYKVINYNFPKSETKITYDETHQITTVKTTEKRIGHLKLKVDSFVYDHRGILKYWMEYSYEKYNRKNIYEEKKIYQLFSSNDSSNTLVNQLDSLEFKYITLNKNNIVIELNLVLNNEKYKTYPIYVDRNDTNFIYIINRGFNHKTDTNYIIQRHNNTVSYYYKKGNSFFLDREIHHDQLGNTSIDYSHDPEFLDSKWIYNYDKNTLCNYFLITGTVNSKKHRNYRYFRLKYFIRKS